MTGQRHYLRVVNFDELQSPKRPKKPTWIKSFVGDLDDPEYLALSPAARGALADFTRLAASMGNRVPDDTRFIAGRLGMHASSCAQLIGNLKATGFLNAFAEDLKESKKKDLEEKIATRPLPRSKSTSEVSPFTPSSTTRLRVVPDAEPNCAICDGEGCFYCEPSDVRQAVTR